MVIEDKIPLNIDRTGDRIGFLDDALGTIVRMVKLFPSIVRD